MRILRKAGDVPKRSLWQKIKDVALTDVAVLARGGVSAGSLEKLEELLLESDFGVPTTLKLVAEVERRAQRDFMKPRWARRSTSATSLRVVGTPKSASSRSSSSFSREPAETPPRARTATSVRATSLIFCQRERLGTSPA